MTPATIRLDAVLDLAAAAPLRETLMAHRGSDLELDAGRVERLGGLCLQVLLAARQAWVLDRREFRMVNVSEPCRDAAALAQACAALGMES